MQKFLFFLKCLGCQRAPTLAHFPLCTHCSNLLQPCPPICPFCKHLHHRQRCEQSSTSNIENIWARFVLLEKTFQILKTWKKHSNFFLKSKFFSPLPHQLKELQQIPFHLIVPVAQQWFRSWSLKRSPTWELSQYLSKKLSLPILPLLTIPQTHPAQAKKNKIMRLSNPPLFQCKKIVPRRFSSWFFKKTQPFRILLIDDFCTTGSTLESAALCLKQQLPNLYPFSKIQVWSYVLGYRPFYSKTKKTFRPQSHFPSFQKLSQPPSAPTHFF